MYYSNIIMRAAECCELCTGTHTRLTDLRAGVLYSMHFFTQSLSSFLFWVES